MPIVVALQKLTHKATTGALKANAERVAVALLGPSLRSGAFSVSAKVKGCESTLLEFAVQHGLPLLTTALTKENADVTIPVPSPTTTPPRIYGHSLNSFSPFLSPQMWGGGPSHSLPLHSFIPLEGRHLREKGSTLFLRFL